jgi:hypothetical protein
MLGIALFAASVFGNLYYLDYKQWCHDNDAFYSDYWDELNDM